MKYIVNSLALTALLLPSFAFGQMIINEIAWMGIPVEGVDSKQWWRYEFLELYNTGEEAVLLDGWKIELHREKLDLEIPLYGKIDGQGYFLISSSNKILGADVNYGSLAGEFVNSGQKVVLSACGRSPEGRKEGVCKIVEELDAKQGWFGGDNDLKLTMERRFLDRGAADHENWGSSMRTGGTPKAENSILGREAFLKLDSAREAQDLIKKDSSWSSFAQTITNAVFMRAFLVAVLSAAAVLALRRYLIGSLGQGEDSFDALKD